MKNKRSSSMLIKSIVVLMVTAAQASAMTSQQAHAIIKAKAQCDAQASSSREFCDEATSLFNQLKKSKKVQLIYQLYLEESVQMEMEFDGHGTAGQG